MNIQRKKLNIAKARRRVQIRSALLLTLAVFAASAFARVLSAASPVPWVSLVLEVLMTILGFGGAAWLGLCVLDGDHRKIVPMRNLSRAQMLWLSLLGVLAVGPAALACDLTDALFLSREAVSLLPAVQGAGLFTARLVKSVLIVPIAEELFFRGYLLHALRPQGAVRACAAASLCFALVHAGSAGALVSCALLGALLCALALRTQSLLAPVLVHACYNLTLIVLGYMGLSGWVMGWSLLACVVKLSLCAAFAAALRRAYTARRVGGTFVLLSGQPLSNRERVLLAASASALLFAMILGG